MKIASVVLLVVSSVLVIGALMLLGSGSGSLATFSGAPSADEAYPAPPATEEMEWAYPDQSAEEVVADVMERWEEDGWVDGEPEIVSTMDVTSEDAEALNIQARLIDAGSSTDVAALLSGSFSPSLPGLDGGSWDHVRIIVDRRDGFTYSVRANHDLDPLYAEYPGE